MKKLLIGFAAALLLGASAVAEDARLTPVEDGHAIVARDGDLFIAAQPTPEDLDAWAAQGVTIVVNLRSRAETAELPFDPAAEAAARGLNYSEIPMGGSDGVSPDIVDQLAAILKDAEGPVVLHCRTGSRAAHAYAAYLQSQGEADATDLADFGWPGGLDAATVSALTR
jgi:uncharacterized protein (TIGR01244 family)